MLGNRYVVGFSLTVVLAGLVACDEPFVTAGTEGGNAMSSSSTGAPECLNETQCTEPANECTVASCDEGTCRTENAPDGRTCLLGICKGGSCTGAPGFPCTNAGDCVGLACVDGVCCTSPCHGTCEACDVSGSAGQCTQLEPGGMDPDTCTGVCEGGSSCVTGNIEAVYQSDQAGSQALLSVAIDKSGDVVAGGLFSGSWTFASATFTALSGQDGMWARFDSSLNSVAFEQYGSSSFARVAAIAVSSQNRIHAGGWFGTNIVLDGTNFNSAGGTDGYVVLSAPDGALIDTVLVGNGESQRIRGVATTNADDLVMVGESDNANPTINGMVLQNQGGLDGFVAVTASDGTPKWGLNVGDDDQDQRVYSVAVDAADNIVVAGRHRGSVTLHALAPLVSPDGRTALVAKISQSGTPLWSKQFGITGDQLIWSTAVDAQNNIGLGGFTSGPVNFGGANLSVIGQRSCMVAKLDGNGNHIWSLTFGEGLIDADNAGCEVRGIAFDPKGNLIVVGTIDGPLDIGLGALPNNNNSSHLSSFVAKFGPNGGPLWARRFNGDDDQLLSGVAVDSAGAIYAAGTMRGTATYDVVRSSTSGDSEALLIKLAP